MEEIAHGWFVLHLDEVRRGSRKKKKIKMFTRRSEPLE